MSTEQNKTVIRKIFDRASKDILPLIDEYFADNFVRYAADGKEMNKEGYKKLFSFLLSTFSDLQTTIEDIVAEGEKVAFRFSWSGTDTKGWRGKPPTGTQIKVTEVYFARFEGGKIVEFKNLIGGSNN